MQARRDNALLKEQVELQAGELQTAHEDLLALLYTVSHDFRGPLNTIDGFNQLLERSLGAEAGDKPRHFASRIKAGVRQMTELMDALLALSRASHGAMVSEPVDLSAIATEILNHKAEAEPSREARLEVAPAITAEGDTRLLTLAMQHLLDNAWKFSKGAPTTHIAFGCEPVEGAGPAYFVRDSGVGFDAAKGGKLFGTFQRLHGPEEFPGTGIGLAIVKKIVERHGGKVWADAQPGQGACFHFTLAPQRRA